MRSSRPPTRRSLRRATRPRVHQEDPTTCRTNGTSPECQNLLHTVKDRQIVKPNVFKKSRFEAASPRRLALCRGAPRLFCEARAAAAGGAGRNRTDDLLRAKQALSQLSYDPFGGIRGKIQDRPIAPRPCLRLVRARQISACPPPSGWWAWVDLNYRPHAYQACALTT